MSDIEKLNPKGLLGRNSVDAAAVALIFGYQLRVVKLNGLSAITKEKIATDGYNPKRWDVGIQDDIVTELWVPPPPAKKETK